jgi:hypothetical protein
MTSYFAESYRKQETERKGLGERELTRKLSGRSLVARNVRSIVMDGGQKSIKTGSAATIAGTHGRFRCLEEHGGGCRAPGRLSRDHEGLQRRGFMAAGS